jgi:hypothetical protein
MRIHIRVRTDELGNWAAYGWGGPRGECVTADEFLKGMMESCDGKQSRYCWVDVDVPMPSESEVKGTVSE